MPPPGFRVRIAVGAAFALVTTLLSSCSSSTPQSSPNVPPLVGVLHVAHPAQGAAYLADAHGREVELRGVAVVGLEDIAYDHSGDGPALYPIDPADYDGSCPKTSPLGSQGPVCEVEAGAPASNQSISPTSGDDFAEIRSLGMNVVRLVIDWSEIEPAPGVYSTEFLDRVAQVVGWARTQGISVILDMHQDEYSRFILPSSGALPSGCAASGGYDGAPLWAVFTDGEPSCAQFGQADLNPAVAAAFDNFWHNRRARGAIGASPGPGLQDQYIGAIGALARRFSTDPAVIGYELMNEPLPGAHSKLPLTDVVTFSNEELYPFYRRAIEALTGVRDGLPTCPASDPSGELSDGPPPYPTADTTCAYPDLGIHTHQSIFFEPSGYRNLLDFSPQSIGHFSSYPNLVFTPHIYTHAFTIDSFIGVSLQTADYPPSFTFGYQTALAEAEAMGTAVLTTEFGDNSGSDTSVLADELAAQDRTAVGGTLWAWDGLASSAANCWCVREEHSSYQTSQTGLPGKGNPDADVGAGHFIASRVAELAQPLPLAVSGQLESWVSDPARHAFAIDAVTSIAAGSPASATLVEIPSSWSGTSVSATGAGVKVQPLADHARLAVITPQANGPYTVTIEQATSDIARTASLDATNPLPPIGQAEALGDLRQFVASSEQSTDKSISSNAALVALLAQTVLGVNG